VALTIGLDVGGTKILALALSSGPGGGERDVLGVVQRPTPDDDPAQLQAALADAVAAVLDEADRAAGRTAGPVAPEAIGMGLPGFLGLDGVARQAPNLPAAIGLDVRGPLEDRIGVPVYADNDANCAAWAAHVVDAPDTDFLVAVTFGTGIGGGFVIDGDLVRGEHGFAGEPGHMIVDVDGTACVCGQHGCWEVYASGNGLGRLARQAVEAGRAPSLLAAAGGVVDHVDGPVVGTLVARGDAAAGAVMDEYAGWVAVGLVNLVNLLDPGVIVVGGGVVDLGDALMDRVRAALARYPTAVRGRDVAIRPSSLGSRAGGMGAALLAAERLARGEKPGR
jgi:glucokinase